MKKIDFKKYILLFIGTATMVFASYLGNNIYNASFEQYIYSIIKIAGVGGEAVHNYFFVFGVAFLKFTLLNFIFIFPTINFDKKIIVKNKRLNKERQILPIKNIKRYSRIVLALGIIYLGIIVGFFDYANSSLRNTDLYRDYYVSPDDVKIVFPEQKNNLIYIFMESTETTNVSKEKGGVFDESIMPNLERMALDNINFSNTNLLGGAQSSPGSGWTVAAMISQTSGVPLKLKVNDYEINSTSFNNITTLGDVLYKNGYNSYLLLGSDSSFGGRKAYFSNHNYDISDYYTAINEGRISDDYHEWWGYEDSKLFTYAKDKLLKLSQSDKPFNLTILTANTHFTDGYLDHGCEEVFDNSYANSFYCSDNMINEFVNWVKNQDFYENTTIIISGDHPTMQNNFYDIDDDYTRTIYNVFINSKVKPIDSKNRIFTTLDMFPTTIGALGANIEGNRLGLGTNLFSDKKTLPEKMGLEEFNKELKKGSSYYYNYIRK